MKLKWLNYILTIWEGLNGWTLTKERSNQAMEYVLLKNVNGLGVRCDQITSTLHISKNKQ